MDKAQDTTGAADVRVWREALTLPTYLPMRPDRHPMFLQRRVYQGSSGKVYPLPFYDRISTDRTDRQWKAVYLENRYLRVTLLPELGGRIHAIEDRCNGYDLVYNQPVIKPALVGLAGPWVSGGIEFNWPQHHRPATFMPVDTVIERGSDGSATVWMSDHEPMSRMKGMHGVCLHPDRAVLELKVRLYNRSPYTRTFLWWANVATEVHELYQSFFPPDVRWVADHARRATSTFPHCSDRYYGVDYARRAVDGVPPAELPRKYRPPAGRYSPADLSWYANIPVPTSYMCMGSRHDFFGGYDHRRQAGIVHIASHHLSPGKKQWTWGNHDFGYAWDRNLTDARDDGSYPPYIELMAGVFTDNQPDFSFLAPGETRTFAQHWYPIREIGPADYANTHGAVSLAVAKDRTGATARIGVHTTEPVKGAEVRLTVGGVVVWHAIADLVPEKPLIAEVRLAGPPRSHRAMRVLEVIRRDGAVLIQHVVPATGRPDREGKASTSNVPKPATEPPPPEAIASADELFTVGTHLAQYRHATRSPEAYWQEALRRDPLDSRCNIAMGHLLLQRGEFEPAEASFQRAVARQTSRNPNPPDGEAYYGLGLALRFQDRDEAAYDAFYKATWNQAHQSQAFLALAEIDLQRGATTQALSHLQESLRRDSDQLRARDYLALGLQRLGRADEARRVLQETLALDPMDCLARDLLGAEVECDSQTRIDLAIDYLRVGEWERARRMLESIVPADPDGTAPLKQYYLAYAGRRGGLATGAVQSHVRAGESAHADYCFPHRLEDFVVLNEAAAHDNTPQARFLLGCWLYDRLRHREAIEFWRESVRHEPGNAVAWRCIGIGAFNIERSASRAKQAYDRAVSADPQDPRLIMERDQLWKRLGVRPERRLAELRKFRSHVEARDDLTVEFCSLLIHVRDARSALECLCGRAFQPWEGGEGQALGQFVRASLVLGRAALSLGDARSAAAHFRQALAPPESLGEARHLLANPSEIHYELGRALRLGGERDLARQHLSLAADFEGDFQDMSVCRYSELTYYSALAARLLGRRTEADRLLRGLLDYAKSLSSKRATIDYFATSLPTMLLFEDDLDLRQQQSARLLRAMALHGLGEPSRARSLLRDILRGDPAHVMATDLLHQWTSV